METSSRDKPDSDESDERSPVSAFVFRSRTAKLVSELNSDGIVPVSALSDRSSQYNIVQSPSADGIVPV